jgi:hypothetical protein
LISEKLVVGTFQAQVTTQLNGTNETKEGVWNFELDGDGNVDKCNIDQCIENFGQTGDLAIIGDWNGTGKEEIGAPLAFWRNGHLNLLARWAGQSKNEIKVILSS